MDCHFRSLSLFFLAFSLHVLDVSALLNYTNYKLPIANSSNEGFAQPPVFFKANSTNPYLSGSFAPSGVPSSASVAPPPPQSEVPATTAAPQQEQPGLLPDEPAAAPPPKQTSPPPNPPAAPAPPDPNTPDSPEENPEPAPRPRSSIARQVPVASASENTSTPKSPNQPNSPPFSPDQGQSPGQGQPAPAPNANNPSGGSPIYTLSANGNTFLATPLPSSQYAINSQTLPVGGSITVNGVPISLPTPGSSIVIGSSTLPFTPAQPTPNSPPGDPLQNQGGSPPLGTDTGTITIANTPIAYSYSPSASALILVGSQTLTPGATATINGVPVSLPSTGSSLIIGGSSTVPLAPPPTAAPSPPLIVIGGQTLTPGAPAITVDNTPISLPTSGSSLVVDGTRTLPLNALQTISIGSQALVISEAGGSSGVIVYGSTIARGSAAVVDGVTVSVPAQGTGVVIGASTTAPLGGMIFSALGVSQTAVATGTGTGVGGGESPVETGASAGSGEPVGFTGGSSVSIEAWGGWRRWWVGGFMGIGFLWFGFVV